MSSNKIKTRTQKSRLTRHIQISGFVAFLLFLAVIFLSIAFLRQIQIQNQNYEVGTLFSDRSVSQLQRETLRMRSLVANPDLVSEDDYILQLNLLQSRLNVLNDSINKIQPTEEITAEYLAVVAAWERLEPAMMNWESIQDNAALQADVLDQLVAIELRVNNMARLYEVLRVNRGETFIQAGERLALWLGVVILLFILFVLTVIYNTYRFVQERTQAEAQVAMYANELERSNQELQQFAYVASHDLQEPLRKIRTFGERLKMRNAEKLDRRSLDYIARMNNAAERMQQLIEDLLTFSRVTTQSIPFERVDLNHVAQEVMADLEARIEQVEGQVIVQSLPTIKADPPQMHQLLQNLVGNGLKFHREGVPPVVTVKGETVTKNGRKQARLTIADNGIGIDSEHLDSIFEMFQRLHGRSDYEGTGIGLSICRRIVERHDGTITVESQPGKGTTFIVTLPAQQNQ